MSDAITAGSSLGTLFFAFIRFTAFLVAAPFPGHMTPGPVRVMLAGGLALSVLPAGTIDFEVVWVRAVLVEVALGLCLGFALMLCLQAFALAGEVGGAQMGLSNAGLGNPLAIDVNLMGSGYTFLVLAIFVVGEGPARILILMQRSFDVIPAGAGGWPLEQTAVVLVGQSTNMVSVVGLFFGAALQAAAPLIAAAFAAQVCLGVLARAIPNLNWLVEGPSLTLSAGIIGLAASLETFAPVLTGFLESAFSLIMRSMER